LTNRYEITGRTHSGHEKRGLSDIKVDHLIRNLICNRMQ